jgi:hypothetical protein
MIYTIEPTFALNTKVYCHNIETNSIETIQIPNTEIVTFIKKKIADHEQIDKIVLLGPITYTEGLKNQLSSSLEFAAEPIKIELKEFRK